MQYLRAIVIIMLLAICSGLITAQVPRTLSYQGVLTDSLGNPNPDNTYNLTFRLYGSLSGGSELWTEAKTLQVRRGLFSTVLGDQTAFPDSLLFDRPYWLSLQVGSDPELSPRIPLTAVGYSLYSMKTDTAKFALHVPTQAVVDSARIAGTVPDNSITSNQIANGTMQLEDIGQNGASTGQVIKWNGSAWSAANDSGGTGGAASQWTTNGSAISYSSGNVGIGTTTPSAPLEVNGSIVISRGDGPQLILRDRLGTAERPRISFSGDPITIFDGDTSMGHVYSFMNNFSSARTHDAALQVHGKAADSWGTYIGLAHDGSNGTLSTDVGNIILAPGSGQVGIGISNPTQKLDVGGRMLIRSGGDLTTSAGLWLNNVNNSALNAFIGMEDDSTVGFYGNNGAGWNFGMNTSTGNIKMFGKLGIGTTTPNAPLSFPPWLGEKITLYPGTTGDVGFSVFGNELRVHTDYSGADITFGYDDNASGFTERMRVKGNGNVGIGTPSPSATLAVASSGTFWNPQLAVDQTNGGDWSRLRMTNANTLSNTRFWDIAGYIGTGGVDEDRLNLWHSSGVGALGIGGNGAIYVNNNAGQQNQVLTSGGPSTPAQWQSVGSIVKTWYAFYDAGSIDVPTMEMYLNSNAEQSVPSLTMTITVDVPSRLIISSQAMFDCECAGFDCSNNITFYLKVDGVKSRNVYFRGEGDEWTTGTIANVLWDVGAGVHTIEVFCKKTHINSQNMHVTGEYASIVAIPN